MQDMERVRERLDAQRKQILDRTGAVERDLRRRLHPDSEERATERENDSVLERLDEEGRAEIGSIDAALARIDAGTYGTCAACGEPVGARRLSALPYATSCIDCASREEG